MCIVGYPLYSEHHFWASVRLVETASRRTGVSLKATEILRRAETSGDFSYLAWTERDILTALLMAHTIHVVSNCGVHAQPTVPAALLGLMEIYLRIGCTYDSQAVPRFFSINKLFGELIQYFVI